MPGTSLKFHQIVAVFEQLKNTRTLLTKQSIFQSSLNEWRKECTCTMELLPIIRLFLTTCERQRVFNMGPQKLASFIAKSFNDDREDYVNIINKHNEISSTNLLAEYVYKEYNTNEILNSTLTCIDINDYLDFLSLGSSMIVPDKLTRMEKLVKSCSQAELKWLFHIILKNVESAIGVSPNKLLTWIAPQALSIWDQSHDLRQVMSDDMDDEHLFRVWTPMLLQKQKRNDWYSNIEKYGGSKFFLQIKFDGENVLLHKKKNQYRWFTRNNNDFSKEYGDSALSIGKLANRIHPYFRADCETAIFNCELMLWDKHLKKLCRHNDRETTSDSNIVSYRHIKPDDNQQLTVVLFDILYYNGKPLFGAPLSQRLELLNVAPLKKNSNDTIFIAEYVEGSTKHDIMQFFEKAMANNEEGIVVKRADSQYFKGQRNSKNGWFKLKPSASKDCDLDLALVAIMPHSARYGKALYIFAAKDGESANFRICLSVSYGLSEPIRHQMGIAAGNLSHEPPNELKTRFGTKPRNIDVDYGGYIDPERWLVVKITSNGVRNGKLVDPVMTEWRMDKPVEQCNTFEDFADYETRILDCKLPDDEKEVQEEIDRPEYSPKRARIESVLSNIEVAVLQGTSTKLRTKCEEILKKFDAKVVKNFSKNTQLIIATAPKPEYVKTSMAIKSQICNVIKSDWVLRCEEENTLSPWKEEDVFHSVPGAFQIDA